MHSFVFFFSMVNDIEFLLEYRHDLYEELILNYQKHKKHRLSAVNIVNANNKRIMLISIALRTKAEI